VDAAKASVAAIDKAQRSINPVAIEPGNYTVILEPNAVGDLVGNMLFALNARSADEGRSVFSKKGGGNRLGEKFFGDQVNIFTDPSYPGAPGGPFDGQGMPTKRLDFVSGGVIKNLSYDRYWAKKQGKEPTPGPTNIIFQGGTASIDDMIKSTERGILVTRFWYIRPVDAQTLLVTGLTRDGLFLIENGRIKSSIKNFRFNETPIKMLNNIEMMGPATRIIGSERLGANIPVIVPALKVKDFSFTSLSEAV
jgi:predicted Zn-dependent protease